MVIAHARDVRLVGISSLHSSPAFGDYAQPERSGLYVVVVTTSSEVADTMRRAFTATGDEIRVVPAEHLHRARSAQDRTDVVCLDARTAQPLPQHLHRWREQACDAQLIVTHLATLADACEALRAGSDDAITLLDPTLESRLYAASRRARARGTAPSGSAIGDVSIHAARQRIVCAGAEIPLSRREAAVLQCLLHHGSEWVSLAAINASVWGGTASRGVIHVYMGYVRDKLAGSRRVRLETRRGSGYRLSVVVGDEP